MHITTRLPACLVVMAILTIPLILDAEDETPSNAGEKSPAPAEFGFVDLFNGEDLTKLGRCEHVS